MAESQTDFGKRCHEVYELQKNSWSPSLEKSVSEY
jgi:hypothetical protein